MSEVISFRLSEDNPREAQAREVLNAWVDKGYSVRHIITEALLQLGKEPGKHGDNRGGSMAEIVDRLASLVARLEGHLPNAQSPASQVEPELKSSFVAAIKKAARPGLRSD
jgi:hypothetical protein